MAVGSLLWWYERPDVCIDVGLGYAFLEGVIDSHVYPMDIFRPWDVAVGTGEVYIYHRIYGSLRSRLVVAGGRGDSEFDRNDPLVVDIGKTLAHVQGLPVLGTDFVQGTIDIVPRGRNDICVASLVNDPAPTKSMSRTDR
jgi:hypothetical protein